MVSRAPVRIADLGGWTDTWFAGRGRVLNVAVEPGVEVRIRTGPPGSGIRIVAANFGDDYRYDGPSTSRHPLIEAAIDAADLPGDAALIVTVESHVPPGAGTGTSAAVAVALAAALDRLTGRQRTAHELAAAAHALEVERLGQESGIQDQIAAAFGGVSFIDMPEYPRAVVTPVAIPPEARAALAERLVLVFLGRAHQSSNVHREVIAALRADPAARGALDRLRRAAEAGRDALAAGDLDAFGQAMTANTEAQAALHPALVSADATRAWTAGRAAGAVGWKVNGAGGEGGSVTLLAGPEDGARERVLAAIARQPGMRVIPVTLADKGVQTEESR